MIGIAGLRQLCCKRSVASQPWYEIVDPDHTDIIGPGIEEEYADLRPRVDSLLDAWRDHSPNGSTAIGSIVVPQHELTAERIPIPLDRSYLGTIRYLVGSGEAGGSLPVDIAMAQIRNILQGRSLVIPPRVPVVISMIDDLVDEMHRTRPEVADDPVLLELDQEAGWHRREPAAPPPPAMEPRRPDPRRPNPSPHPQNRADLGP